MIDIEQGRGSLRISRFDENGKITFEQIQIPEQEMFEWDDATKVSEVVQGWETWEGKKVKKRKTSFLSRYRLEEFLHSLPEETKKTIYSANQPKVWFCDIEVEVSDDGFPEPEVAANPISTICFTSKNKAFVLSTRPLDESVVKSIQDEANQYFSKWNANVSLVFMCFERERDMLYTFFHKYVPQMPLITGWNFIDFDWKYLINRAKRFNVPIEIVSPSGNFIDKENFIPQHRPVVDYMMIYKKWDTKILIKESSKLDYVSEQVLGVQKLKYSGTLKDLLDKDFRRYVLYNLIDTLLVEYIDKEISVLQTYIQLANTAKVELIGAFSPIRMTEALLVREFYDRKKVIVKKQNQYQANEKNTKGYTGAFVKDPRPGLYEWVVTYDFASLYPTVMRQFNISPETYLGKREDLNGEQYIKTATGAIYRSDQDSASRTFLTRLFNMRVQTKDEAKKIEKAIEKLKQLKKQAI